MGGAENGSGGRKGPPPFVLALFVLIPAVLIAVIVIRAQRDWREKQRAEKLEWQEAQAVDTVEAYEEFLRQFPGMTNSHAALARLQALRWSQQLTGEFSSPDPKARAYTALAWGKKRAQGAPAIPFLVKMLGDLTPLEWSNTNRRDYRTSPGKEAAFALAQIGPAAFEPLMAAMKSESCWARGYAARGLGRLKDPRALVPLIAALKDEFVNVWESAALGLGELGDRRAVGSLIEALAHNSSYDMQQAAVWALQGLTHQDFYFNADKWQQWWEQNKGDTRPD
jgi:hypothetical protein